MGEESRLAHITMNQRFLFLAFLVVVSTAVALPSGQIVPEEEGKPAETYDMFSTAGHAAFSRLDTEFDSPKPMKVVQQPTAQQWMAAPMGTPMAPMAAAMGAPVGNPNAPGAMMQTGMQDPAAAVTEASPTLPPTKGVHAVSKNFPTLARSAVSAEQQKLADKHVAKTQAEGLNKGLNKVEVSGKVPAKAKTLAEKIKEDEAKEPELKKEIAVAKANQAGRITGVEGMANVRSLEQEDGKGGGLEKEVQEERGEAEGLVTGGFIAPGWAVPKKNVPSYSQYMHQQFNNNARFMRPGMGRPGMGRPGMYRI